MKAVVRPQSMAERFPLDTKADRIKYVRVSSRELSASADALSKNAETFTDFNEEERLTLLAIAEAVQDSLRNVIYNVHCLVGFDL